MDDLSPSNRPLSFAELCLGFDLKPECLRKLMRQHAIKPACHVGRLAVYGGPQIRAVVDAMRAEAGGY